MNNIDNNCDDKNNTNNNLLGEVEIDLNNKIKIVNEEHLNKIAKEEPEEESIPTFKRCATYCEPKKAEKQEQDQEQEDLPLPTMKKEPAYNIHKEFQTRLQEQRCAKWSHRMTGIVYPNDWLTCQIPDMK